jgi:uncharacterized protein with HEPN domain
MSDRKLLIDLIEEMIEATEKIVHRCDRAECVDTFLRDEEGMILLDSICMQLVALGEAVKKVDGLTDGKLLENYDEVPWRAIAGMRDVLSHHYFDLNAETVYGICGEEIRSVLQTLRRIRSDLFQKEKGREGSRK